MKDYVYDSFAVDDRIVCGRSFEHAKHIIMHVLQKKTPLQDFFVISK